MYAYILDVSYVQKLNTNQNLKLISFFNFSVSINAASKSALGTDCTTDYLLVSFTSHMHKVECTLFRKSCLINLTFVKRVPLQKKCQQMARLTRQLYMNGMHSYIYSSIEMRNFDFGDTPLYRHSNMKPVKQVYFGTFCDIKIFFA